jgi:hypothetical protein
MAEQLTVNARTYMMTQLRNYAILEELESWISIISKRALNVRV